MATKIDLDSTKESAWSGKFEYTIDQDVINNYTTIKIRVWAEKEDGYTSGTNSTTWDAKVTVNGKQITLKSGPGYSLTTSGTWIGSDKDSKTGDTAEFKVYHNNDGSVSFDVSVRVYPASGLKWDGERLTYSGTFGTSTGQIPKIPRASAISSAKNVYFGDPCSITWTPPSSSFYYKLKFTLGGQSKETEAFCPETTESYTYTEFSIPLYFAEEIPNSSSALMSVALSSYDNANCTTQIGSTSTATFTVSVPDNDYFRPQIVSKDAVVINSEGSILNDWGVALAGISGVKLSLSAKGKHGAKVTSFSISGDDVSAVVLNNPVLNVSEESGDTQSSEYNINVIPTSGNKEFVITCVDSRGVVSNQYVTNSIHFLPYSSPSIMNFSVTKDTNKTENVDDDRMVASADWDFCSVKVYDDDETEIELNGATAKLEYKLSTSNGWTTCEKKWEDCNDDFKIEELGLSETKSYNFRIIVTDKVGTSVEKAVFASTTTVLMDFQAGGKGLGVGKICEIDNSEKTFGSMEVAMDSYFFGNIQMQPGSVLVLSDEMYGDEPPEEKFKNVVVPAGRIYFKKVSS